METPRILTYLQYNYKKIILVDYDTINLFIEERSDINHNSVNNAISKGKINGKTFIVDGVNVKYKDSEVPFTKYNKYAIENTNMGLSFAAAVFKLTYDNDILLIRGAASLGVLLASRSIVVSQEYTKDRVITTKDGSGTDVVVERVN